MQQVGERFGAARRTMRLGFLPVYLDDLVAPAVREFRQRHAGTQVSLFELPPRAQLDRLRARELDAAVLGEEPVTVEVETLVSLLRDQAGRQIPEGR